MKIRTLLLALAVGGTLASYAQTSERYIEVTGTSEIEIVPDKIHYLIEIREYFEEEFDGKSKPEEYRTKVPLSEIELGYGRRWQKLPFRRMPSVRKKSATTGGDRGRIFWYRSVWTLR